MTESQPAGVGPALGDAGPCPPIVYKDKTWLVGHPTQKAKAELELQTMLAAVANVERLRRVLRPEEYKRRLDALDAKIEGGAYQTWGEVWMSVNNSPDGKPLFLLALLKETHPEATFADARAIWLNEPRQVKRAFTVVIPSFFALLAEDLPQMPEERQQAAAEMATEFMAAVLRLAPSASDTSG